MQNDLASMGNKVLQGEKDEPFLGILVGDGVWLCEEDSSARGGDE